MSQDREYANEISGSLKSKNLLTSKYKIITAGGPSYSCDLLLTYLFNLIRWKVIMLFFSVYLRQYAGWQSCKAAAEGRHN
jgi:hypothetical protein